MAKLDPRNVRIDPLLSGYSVAYRNTMYVAPMVAPIQPSTFDGGQYAVYNKADWFRNEARLRAAGTRAARGEYGITFDSFFCTEVAFAKEVPDELKQNQMDPINVMRDGTEFATDKVLLAKEVRVATKLLTIANWASGHGATLTGGEQFNDYASSDPVSVIKDAKATIHAKTGRKVNWGVISYPVWLALEQHPDLLDRVKYTQTGVVTLELLKKLFDIENLQVAEALYTQSNEGVAADSVSYEYVWGKHIWLGYVERQIGPMRPTAMVQFVAGARSVRSWREEPEKQDVVEASEKCDEKIVSTLLGYPIRDAVA